MYSPIHRQAGTPMIKIQLTLRTASDLCKSVALAVLFGSNGNVYTVFTKFDIYVCIYIYIYIYTHTYSSQYSEAGRAKE
jgi:hypothetical protein